MNSSSMDGSKETIGTKTSPSTSLEMNVHALPFQVRIFFFKFQELFLSGWSTTLPFCLVQWFAYESFVGCIRTGIREPISACIVCVETKKDAISGLVVGRIVIWRLARNPVGVFEWLEWFVCSPFPSFIAYLGIAARCPITVGVICQLWNSFWNRLLKEKPLER